MKRLHVHVSAEDLTRSIQFYTTLFAAGPSVQKTDYAKWMLDDPRVNFAVSRRGAAAGVQHLGIQVETAEELREVHERLTLEKNNTTCCYAQSEKAWISDPQGVAWETFLTTGESTVYGDGVDLDAAGESCCTPRPGRSTAAPCCGGA